MARLDDLKQKYQPVLQAIEKHNVRLANVHIENNKLLIRGEAPTQAAKDEIWDQIKRIDPSGADLTADITVAAGGAAGQAAQPGNQQTYTVKAGDTLSKISQQFYGDANKYMTIFDANRDKLKDPDKIHPGKQLVIPPKAA